MASAAAGAVDPGSDFTVSSAEQEEAALESAASSSPKRLPSRQRPQDRRAMLHELQLAKIQLSQRTAELESRSEQWRSHEEDLVERLGSAERECAQLRQQLEHELAQLRADTRRREDRSRRCLDEALARQRRLEEANAQLLGHAGDLKLGLQGSLTITEAQSRELQSRPEDQLSVRELVCLRLHLALQPLRQQLDESVERAKAAGEERNRVYDEAEKLRDCLAGERRLHLALQEAYQKVVTELADVRSQVHTGNYKVAHFDEVKHDRDRLSSQCEQLQGVTCALEQQVASVAKERDQLARDLASAQQTGQLVRQDTAYLSKQVGELSTRAVHAEDRAAALQRQLDEARAARDAALERSLVERDRMRGEFELRLHSELERLRTGGEAELDRLRRQTLDMQEAQVRAMREQRDQAGLERDSAVARFADAEDRLRETREELARAAGAADRRVTELTAELRVREFEQDRATLLMKEAQARLEELALEQERLRGKLQSTEQEFHRLELTSRHHQQDQRMRIEQLSGKLEAYEAAERELDAAVLQAAEIGAKPEDGCTPDQLIAAGVAMPTTARRRLRQSVELARRVLQLERQAVELNAAHDRQRAAADEYRRKLERLEATLADAEQPYGYLVESLRSRDAELDSTRQRLAEAESRLAALTVDRNRLAEARNRMGADLERLIAQREEVTALRKAVASLQSRKLRGRVVAAGYQRPGGGKQRDSDDEKEDELKPSQPYALHYS